ncbi:hypothetical protein JXB41_09150 [Candidatus Woesearchaeota archaeon]|nr:hypothetical protein [Candidatus Woesearchaeota archaeon]
MVSSSPKTPPMNRETIVLINDVKIDNEKDYYDFIDTLEVNQTIYIETKIRKNFFFSEKKSYILQTKPEIRTIELNETERIKVIEEDFDESLNKTINKTKYITQKKTEDIAEGIQDIGIRVYTAPTTNIKLGLDLQGGTRVVLQPEEKTSSQDIEALVESMSQRLNIYGLSDVVIRSAGDLSGNQFIIVEIAGATEEEVRELLAKQGKFEAKIGNKSVFLGGNDITYVCRSAQCAGIDPSAGCRSIQGGYSCRFRFTISLSSEAAQRQADVTQNLEVVYDPSGEEYLSQDLNLYLDDIHMDTLKISADLKGQASTDIAISGSGTGINMQEARNDALKNMKKLQTVLITGSLPVKLDIIKTDTISPSLGKEFLSNALLIGLLSMASVTLIVYIRYRKIKIAVPIIIVITSEILLILGVAALLGQNLDIAGIAGIIVAIGTGVDDQIVITDETLKKEKESYLNWKQKLKKAFFIVVAAYAATMASMLPLLFAGAGLLRGFAITTMIGVTNGVLITRPAFSKMIEILLKDEVE